MADLGKGVEQVAVHTESSADVSARSFCKQETMAVFGIRIVNLDALSYLLMTPKNAIAKAEEDKKHL